MTNGRPDITVVVATLNRAALLAEMLQSLAQQQTRQEFTYEVVVVDNGSTDETGAQLRRLAASYPVRLTALVERQLGKPAALNTGIATSEGRIVVVTDDDVVADPTWLLALWHCFRETEAGAVGGRVMPLWVDGRPEWLTDHLMGHLGTLGCLNFGSSRIVLSEGPDKYWVVGSNIAVRREVVERLGGFDVRRLRGEDIELFNRYRREGVKVVYEPEAVVHHRVGKERLTPVYFRAWYEAAGRYRAYGMPWRPHHLITLMPLYGYRELLRWTRLYWKTSGSPDSAWERLGYECRARGWLSTLRQRVLLWPRWCLTVLTGRSCMPSEFRSASAFSRFSKAVPTSSTERSC